MPIDENTPARNDCGEGNTSFFWPILILILGTLVSTTYQIVVMQDQLQSLTQAAGQMEPKVKQAQYAKARLYRLASDVFQLSATDANAKRIVTDYKIEQRLPSSSSQNDPAH